MWAMALRAVVIPALLILSVLSGGYLVYSATDVSGAQYTMVVTITNAGSDLEDSVMPFPISGAGLIDDAFISSDALNSLVRNGSTDIPAMPPSGRIAVAGAATYFGGSFTDRTTEASAAAGTFPLLADSPAAGDAVYFAFDFPARVLTLNIGTVGAGTYTLKWQYWNGTAYVDHSNVDDRSSAFQEFGLRTISWDQPADWATNTVTGTAVTAYWARANVDTFTSQTTQPVGSQALFENGEWWTWLEDIDRDDQVQYTVYLGGPGIVTAHQVFPGAAGIITGDAATLEVSGAFSMALKGRFDFTAAGTVTCVVCKTGAVTVSVSGSAATPALAATFTGGISGTPGGDVAGITILNTGEQTTIIAGDGTDLAVWVNATTGGMKSVTVPPGGIADTANNWTWASNGGIDYFDWIKVDTVTASVFDMSTTYADWAPGTHTGTQAYTGALGLANP